ncbi:MAG: hypothetical protein COB73_07570 [Flavobacteriaceae bacterium]|nr:MAG: hypothetical protein COB73_07570 [Flavobacteriaceae bacterium]
MKKVILFILLAGFLTTANAQKKSYQEKKAKENTTYIADKMELNKKDSNFLHEVLLEKYTSVSSQIKGNDLSKEEKKAVYKASYSVTSKKLAAQFSKDEIKEIFSLLKEINANSKK